MKEQFLIEEPLTDKEFNYLKAIGFKIGLVDFLDNNQWFIKN